MAGQGWRPRPSRSRRVSPAAACSPPGAPPPRPRPRRAGTSEPRPPGASRPRSERPSSSFVRRQRQQKAREGGGGGRKRPFLRRPSPAGIAAGGAPARRGAAQRLGGAGALVSASARRLPSSVLGRRPAGRPLLAGARDPQKGEAVASPGLGRVRDGGSGSPSLYSLRSFLDPHLLGFPPLGSATQGDPAPALPQVFHVSRAFASQRPSRQVGTAANASGFPWRCALCALLASTLNFCGFRAQETHDFNAKKNYRGLYLEIKFGLNRKKAV